nr:RecName: Full=U1-plectoxin-Pt1e; Short=U1-PLTX-Pt1e; AltName: Full=Plectoxin XIII; Short=PLT-XIII; Short=PLTXIII; AltName: Full=Plectoxin-13 [Plectreurys tristis]
ALKCQGWVDYCNGNVECCNECVMY